MSGREETDAAEGVDLYGFDDFQTRLGDIMRGERATLGKSLLDVQRELRIKATHIAAIENTDPSAFDTPSFVAGYVRSYARYLGLDPDWAYGEFCREGKFTAKPGAADGSVERLAKPVANSGRGVPNALGVGGLHAAPPRPMLPGVAPGALGSVTVLLVLISALLYGGYTVFKEIQQVRLAPVEQSPVIASEPETFEGAASVAETPVRTAALAPPALHALDQLYRPQALEVPVVTERDGPIAMVEPGSLSAFKRMAGPARGIGGAADRQAGDESGAPRPASLADATDPGDTTATVDPIDKAVAAALGRRSDEPAASGQDDVVLVATRPAWVRIRAADGTVLLEKTLQGEETYALPDTEKPPKLRAGNSGAVYFMVGSKTYGPSAPGAQVVDDIVLDPEALRERYDTASLADSGELARVVAALRSAPEAR